MTMLRQIERFLQTYDMKPTPFGRRVLRDGGLVRDLRNGRELRPHTAQRIAQFMTQHSNRMAAKAERDNRHA